jgi:hypothetical protein
MSMKRILLVLIIFFIFLLTYILLNTPLQLQRTAEITHEATAAGQMRPVQ